MDRSEPQGDKNSKQEKPSPGLFWQFLNAISHPFHTNSNNSPPLKPEQQALVFHMLGDDPPKDISDQSVTRKVVKKD